MSTQEFSSTDLYSVVEVLNRECFKGKLVRASDVNENYYNLLGESYAVILGNTELSYSINSQLEALLKSHANKTLIFIVLKNEGYMDVYIGLSTTSLIKNIDILRQNSNGERIFNLEVLNDSQLTMRNMELTLNKLMGITPNKSYIINFGNLPQDMKITLNKPQRISNDADKFDDYDREKCLLALECFYQSPLSRESTDGRTKKFYKIRDGKYVVIFGGRGDWHGINIPLGEQLRRHPQATDVIVVKKYYDHMDLFYANGEKLVTNMSDLSSDRIGGQLKFKIDEIDSNTIRIHEVDLRLNKIATI